MKMNFSEPNDASTPEADAGRLAESKQLNADGMRRRSLLKSGASVALAALAGGIIGYKERPRLLEWREAMLSPQIASFPEELERNRFLAYAAVVFAAQRKQTREIVTALKAKYESPIFGKVRVWEMIEKLGMCIDPTDSSLYLTSQYVHVQQILEGMERNGVKDDRMIITALLHDIGKVMLLTTEAPENIVCYTKPIGEYTRGIGMDNVFVQFGHDEMIYSRLKDYVPEEVAWTIRYHSAEAGTFEQYLSEHEREKCLPLLEQFRAYDQGTKSDKQLPRVDMRKYRAMVEDMFPQPILL